MSSESQSEHGARGVQASVVPRPLQLPRQHPLSQLQHCTWKVFKVACVKCPNLCINAEQHFAHRVCRGSTCAYLSACWGECVHGVTMCNGDGHVCVYRRVGRCSCVCCLSHVCMDVCVQHGGAGLACGLGAYAACAGRTQCPWQQPRPRRWEPEDSGAAVVAAHGES